MTGGQETGGQEEKEAEVVREMEKHEEIVENSELVLFQEKECYVYMIPPRKSAASYRADEWDINKWAWEGSLKVVSKGEQCCIRLEDAQTGELYAQAPIRKDQPLPVEAVIDSSRFFVLRIEDTSSGKGKHAFVGLGFRERPQAYDFQAAVFDHMKYLNKKKEAEEMEQEYQARPSADYSLKKGETLHLQLKTSKGLGGSGKPKVAEKTVDGSGQRELMPNPDTPENYPKRSGLPCLAPPPTPPTQPAAKGSPTPPVRAPSISAVKSSESFPASNPIAATTQAFTESTLITDDIDEDFGDFQAA